MGATASMTASGMADMQSIFPIDTKTIKKEIMKSPSNESHTAKLTSFIKHTLQKHHLHLVRSPTVLVCKQSEVFMDSFYQSSWLSIKEANDILHELRSIGELKRPKTSVVNPKYPLWALYYGLRREKDRALALDRWGSYHESWTRIEDAPEVNIHNRYLY
jgi:hypothetical protein